MFNLFKKNKNQDNLEKRIKCPKCHSWMDKIINQDIIIDVCNSCGGMFLDRDEVVRLVDLKKTSSGVNKKIQKVLSKDLTRPLEINKSQKVKKDGKVKK